MLVKVLTPNGWKYAEQLELFGRGHYMEEVIKCCGTCRYWSRSKWGKGTCELNGKEYNFSKMKDCLGWKVATRRTEDNAR